MPNPRGSSGFGQKFVEEISGDWAGKVYVDLMNGVDQLAALPYVDPSRLGAAGGSYGGYMVNWILGHSNRFKALVSHAGVYNLESMYGVTEELWFPEWEFGGPFWEKPEQYEKWSPHLFVKNFNTPTLVTHGELDYRVPIGEPFLAKEGKDLTILTFGATLYRALDAAKQLEEQYGISTEVIDGRSLVPFDYDKLYQSVKKTGRLILASDACERGSFMHTIASQISTRTGVGL
jgi:hypothetical protein